MRFIASEVVCVVERMDTCDPESEKRKSVRLTTSRVYYSRCCVLFPQRERERERKISRARFHINKYKTLTRTSRRLPALFCFHRELTTVSQVHRQRRLRQKLDRRRIALRHVCSCFCIYFFLFCAYFFCVVKFEKKTVSEQFSPQCFCCIVFRCSHQLQHKRSVLILLLSKKSNNNNII